MPLSDRPPVGAETRTAWAKINLYLHVVGRRADGYHLLDSLVVFAGVGDRLSFAPGDNLRLEIDGGFAAELPDGEDNLVVRSARALARLAGIEPRARIRLHKALPVAAGIGGGSADAAATLDGLAALWGLRPDPAELDVLARGLGADVPICHYGRPAFIGGIGELITRAPPLPPAWLVLVNPGVRLATPEVFRARDGAFSRPVRWRDVFADAAALAEHLTTLNNDLTAPARALAPVIDQVLDALSAAPGCRLARLSGSGATCFGLFASLADARRAADALVTAQPAWWVVPAPLLHGKLDRL